MKIKITKKDHPLKDQVFISMQSLIHDNELIISHEDNLHHIDKKDCKILEEK